MQNLCWFLPVDRREIVAHGCQVLGGLGQEVSHSQMSSVVMLSDTKSAIVMESTSVSTMTRRSAQSSQWKSRTLGCSGNVPTSRNTC